MEFDEGHVIGNYRVIRMLGQGGMGTVYEVEHLELGTHYALKTFTFDAENDASTALKTKFLEEGKLLARLKHPNLTHVFDLGFEEKTQMPYFVMDLVVYEDGETYTVEDIDLQDIDEDLVYKWFGQLARRSTVGHKRHPDVLWYHQYVCRFVCEMGEYFVRFSVKECRGHGGNAVHSSTITSVSMYKAQGARASDPGKDQGEANAPFVDNKLSLFFSAVNGVNSPVRMWWNFLDRMSGVLK